MSLRQPADARVIASRRGLVEQAIQIWTYRSLLARMVRKELQVKYRNSVLGFFWSMLNPALYLVIFYVVFQLVLQSRIPTYAIFLLSGLLVWNFFATAVAGGTTSISDNGALISKVYFPREVLPLASVGAALVHFALQGVVLALALVILRHGASFEHSLAIVPALLVVVVLAAGLALLAAAANVYLRDVQHLVELGLLAWFWMTPIVYQHRLVADRLADKSWSWIQWLNPLTSLVLVFQRGIYNVVATPAGPGPSGGGRPFVPDTTEGGVVAILPADMDLGWYVAHLGVLAAVAVAFLVLGMAVFGRTEANFAEEL